MGWLNTLFDVAQIGLEISQLDQLNQLKNQGAASQVIQAALQELRSRIHYYNETAKTILQYESIEPLATAGAMRVLEYRLIDSGITPDLFSSSLTDMEYVSNTIRAIQANSSRLCGQLPPESQAAIQSLVRKTDLIPELSYYLNHHSEYSTYLEVKDKYSKSPWLANQWAISGIGCLFFFVGVGIPFALFPRGGSGFYAVLILEVAAMIYFAIKASAARSSKQVVDAAEKKLDIRKLEEIDRRYQGNISAAKADLENARAEVQAFFGNSALNPG